MSTLNGRGTITTVVHTADVTLATSDHGKVHSNTGGTTGVITATLPAAALGLWFDFLCDSTVNFVIRPNGADSIGLPGTGAQQTSGLGIQATVRGNLVRLACLKAADWQCMYSVGTTGWTTT